MTNDAALHDGADGAGRDEDDGQREQEGQAGAVDENDGEIGPAHGKGAMGEVDEPHQPERNR